MTTHICTLHTHISYTFGLHDLYSIWSELSEIIKRWMEAVGGNAISLYIDQKKYERNPFIYQMDNVYILYAVCVCSSGELLLREIKSGLADCIQPFSSWLFFHELQAVFFRQFQKNSISHWFYWSIFFNILAFYFIQNLSLLFLLESIIHTAY